MEGLNSVVGDKHDILCITESKLNSSFPKSQLVRKGYKPPYRLDISSTSGGLIIYVRNGISSRFLKDFSLPNDIKLIPVGLRLKSRKWLILFLYRHHSQKLEPFFRHDGSYLNLVRRAKRAKCGSWGSGGALSPQRGC